MLSFWPDCSRLLESELTPQQFAAWIKPLRAINFDDETGDLRIWAPNRLKLDAVRSQFSSRIQAAAASVLHRPVNVVFELEANANDEQIASAGSAPARELAANDAAACENAALTAAAGHAESATEVRAPAAATQNQERARLNPLL